MAGGGFLTLMHGSVALALALGATAPTKIAVMDLHAHAGVSSRLVAPLTANIVEGVRQQFPKAAIVSSEEIGAMLAAEGAREKLGCGDTGCLAEIGGALGADRMVVGTLSEIGETYVLSLEFVDVPHAVVLSSATADVTVSREDQLLEAVPSLVHRLFAGGGVEVEALATPSAAPAPPARSHARSLVRGGAGLVAGAVAVVGLVQVLGYQSEVSALNANTTAVPLDYRRVQADYSAAQVWQPVAVGLGVLALAGLTSAVFTW